MNERQLDAIAKIEGIIRGIDEMNKGGDISNISKVLLLSDLNQLKLQVENINKPYVEIEK